MKYAINLIIILTLSSFSIFGQEKKYFVGDYAQGGVIFWLDETGEHGLVSSISDQSTGVSWCPGEVKKTMALGDGIYSGKSNTLIILTAFGYGNGLPYAASLCNELQIKQGDIIYGDWYLPSREELDLMYLNIEKINEISIANGGSRIEKKSYWSSTDWNYHNKKSEIEKEGDNGAWVHNFGNGRKVKQIPALKMLTHISVRAIRSF